MYSYAYPRPSVTTDCVVFGYEKSDLKILLVLRGGEPYKGCWALPGGFLNMDETAQECAIRELEEETGLRATFMKQLHAFTAVDRDPRDRVITIAHYTLVPLQEVKGADDAADARWFALNELPELAFDHEEIIKMAVEELRGMFNGGKFTVEELQRLLSEAEL